MIKSILKHSPLKYYTPYTCRTFSTLNTVFISATDKGGEGLTSSQGHTGNTSRELSFEEQYAAQRDYELLKKLSDLSQKQTSLFEKIEKSNQMNSDILNLQHSSKEMQSVIEESLASTRVANVDVSAEQAIPEHATPWRSQSTAKPQQPKIVENIQNVSGSTMATSDDQNAPHQTKFMDKSFYPDLTNDL